MKKSDIRWAIRIVVFSVVLATVFTILSTAALEGAGYILSFAILLFLIVVGILFDMIGVAVTAADETPFHSMAANKGIGGKEAIKLIKNADRVSNICNDVVGDITGIISGVIMAVLAVRLVTDYNLPSMLIHLLISGFVVGITIGGKALGKGAAIRGSTGIVHVVALAVYRVGWLWGKLTGRS